jgi:integrase
MKMRREHFVPLSNQAVAILQEVQEISGRKEGYVFTASTGGKQSRRD